MGLERACERKLWAANRTLLGEMFIWAVKACLRLDLRQVVTSSIYFFAWKNCSSGIRVYTVPGATCLLTKSVSHTKIKKKKRKKKKQKLNKHATQSYATQCWCDRHGHGRENVPAKMSLCVGVDWAKWTPCNVSAWTAVLSHTRLNKKNLAKRAEKKGKRIQGEHAAVLRCTVKEARR